MSVLVNKHAPFFHDGDKKFSAVTAKGDIIGDFNFPDATKNKYTVLFFYPLDFTFVCPSEIIAFNNRLAAFEQRNVQLLAVSIDSAFTHVAWRNTPVEKGGIGSVGFTMIADIKREIVHAYDVATDAGVALRASFLIDQQGIVQHQVVNNLSLGRNIDEMLRMVDALQFTEQHGEVCPASWQKGTEGMIPDAQGVATYLNKHSTNL